jgi:glycine hydroxymethyltransferase
MVPFDETSPFVTSGMRIGTAAVTTRGLKENDMVKIADFIDKVLINKTNEQMIIDVKAEVNEWMRSFPLYVETANV